MVRNWDTIRAVLLKLEACERAQAFLSANQVEGIPEQELAYQMMLLEEGHFIEARIHKSRTGDGRIAHAQASRLTWEGHELLDKIRSETVWNKIKSLAAGIDRRATRRLKKRASISLSTR